MHASAAERAYRLGRFTEAASLLANSPRDQVLELELDYFLGHSSRVRANSKRLLNAAPTSSLVTSRCLIVCASQLRDDGEFEEAVATIRKAVKACGETDDLRLIASSYALLLEAECDTTAFDASRTTAFETRRAAIRCADPIALVPVHHTFGRLEARVGHLDRALRHFRMAHRALSEAPNLYLEAAVSLDESSTLSLTGDYASALALAMKAAAVAAESGWSKGIVAAAVNCGHFSILLGQPHECERYLNIAHRQRFSSPSYEMALRETRARLLLLQGRIIEAETLIAEQQANATVNPWYLIQAADTHVRILNRQGRWADAIAAADRVLADCDIVAAKPLEALLRSPPRVRYCWIWIATEHLGHTFAIGSHRLVRPGLG